MRSKVTLSLLALLLGSSLTGCGGDSSDQSLSTTAQPVSTTPIAVTAPASVPLRQAGDPLPGLNQSQLDQFSSGKVAFLKNDVAADGLGPIFNGNSCAECHASPTVGGGGQFLETRFGQTANGTFDPLTSEGGTTLHSLFLSGTAPQVLPADANTLATRRVTPLFGLGLVEAIPDSAIEAQAAAERSLHPDHAGQVAHVASPSDGIVRVGRFGWKCQHALLLDFSGDAYQNEMGINNYVFPYELQPNAAPLPVPSDQLEDVADDNGMTCTDRFAFFMRFMAPLPATTSNRLEQGRQIFNQVGCADCHLPSYQTASPITALNGQPVNAFSDFLLHDVGTGDGIVQGDSPANKLRTSPLWGVAQLPTLLHDGSAVTIPEAIQAHANEAQGASAAFGALSAQDQQSLVDYVNSL